MDAIAVDHRRPIKTCFSVINVNLGSETSNRGRNFCNGNQITDVDNFISGENKDRPSLASYLCQPHLVAVHSSVQASASLQNESFASGTRT